MSQAWQCHGCLKHRDYCICKPPLGIRPKFILKQERKKEILDAMERYAKVNLPVPVEWVQELKLVTEDFK